MIIDKDALAKLQKINAEGKVFKSDDPVTCFGKGVYLGGPLEEVDLTISDADRSGHFGCFGTTRIGKTRLLESIIEQDIKKGYNVVVIDPKGDAELLSKLTQCAAKAGRLDDLMVMTPIFPDLSIKLDPLSHYYMTDELVDHVVSGIQAKEDYFIAVATEVTQAIIEGLVMQRANNQRTDTINFMDVKLRSDYFNLKKFRDSIELIPGSGDLIAYMDQILSSPPDFFAKVSSSLRTTLSALTTGNTGKIIGKAKSNEFIQRFEDGKGVILFCNTGSMLARRTAHIIGRVLVSMIQSLVGRFFASGKKLDPPLCLHIDEGHNILYSGIQELFTKAGGANCWVHFYTQSTAQIEEEVGTEAAKSILDNINTWIYMLVNHPDTAQYMEDSAPMAKKYQPILSFGGGIAVREVEEKAIMAHKVMQLAKRQFYMRSYGKLCKGRTSDSTKRFVNIKLPEIRSA